MRLPAALAALFLFATPLHADEAGPAGDWKSDATTHDLDRLERYEDAVTKGMMESRVAGEENGSYNELVSVMEAETVAADPEKLKGDWHCRTIKAGGPFAGFVVYGWFRCAITERDGRLFFEKLTGSQRQSGFLYPRDEKSWVLLAAPNEGHSGPIRAYSGPAGGIADPQLIDEPAVVSLLADGRARIVFPWPELESTFNVLEMKRRK
ncbi:DUF4893 domain-containing protein [Parvibaculum sp.]|uniref:DUF4893 domain-containing protein n=1 Tax=Parvibaculum sp. TaxID=2024848 RepID=UPI0027195CA5|nr:DUF4893 domain-containing protein [Parvibaculum sp.]MDO9125673.1 DUF4893 domain-containing protein [Parvibaculum sp.]MDP1626073.1 DUF4893 domain-containing protein [Parvibaculum sp.]MDP2151390.1 DUF4893 domain-containing protein [Parvibaculum sp.]MDP3329835.1 DUF4893 domain-containing protein [Parvibaculum sp.]